MTSSDSSSGYGELSGQDLLHQLFKINHLLQRQFEMGLVSYGLPEQLTGPRLRVLLEISAAGKIRMNELAKNLGIKARTVTQFVDALEKDHFIVRTPDAFDRRATILQLTDTAKSLMERAEEVMGEISDKLLERLTLEQRNQLLDILWQLDSNRTEFSTNDE